MPWSEDGAEIFLHKNHLYIPANPWINYDKNPKDYFNKGLLCIDLNLLTKEVKYKIPYPNKEIFINEPFVSHSISSKCAVNHHKAKLIYSFGADHYIYRFSTDGFLKEKYFFGTMEKNEKIIPMNSRNGLENPDTEFIHYANHLNYERLFYDPYKKLYYRLVKHELKNKLTSKDLQIGTTPKFTYSIIIGDDNFKIIDEIILEKGISSGAFIITKDGVMIQSENQSEDEMLFKLYKIKIKK